MSDKNEKKISLYEKNIRDLTHEERRVYEHELVLSRDKKKIHEYMDGRIHRALNTLRGKKGLEVPVDERLYKKLHEKVDKAVELFVENNRDIDSYDYLFSTYYSYFINEALDDIEVEMGRRPHFIKESHKEMDKEKVREELKGLFKQKKRL